MCVLHHYHSKQCIWQWYGKDSILGFRLRLAVLDALFFFDAAEAFPSIKSLSSKCFSQIYWFRILPCLLVNVRFPYKIPKYINVSKRWSILFHNRLRKFYNMMLFCSPWSALSISFQSRRSQSPPLERAVDSPQMIRPQDSQYYYLNDSLWPYTDLKP